MRGQDLKRGDKFALYPDQTEGLVFGSWNYAGRAICSGFPDHSGFGRGFESTVKADTEVYPLLDQSALRGFVATVKQGRITHEVTGMAPSLDRAEEIIRGEFGRMLGTSHRYIGVRWAE